MFYLVPVTVPTVVGPRSGISPAASASASASAGTTTTSNRSSASSSSGPGGGSGSGMGQQQMTPDTAKLKCKNFLATLLRLASEQPPAVAANVRGLIQGLIDGKVEPEVFTNKLQRELNSSPQPCLVPFLKKSLPHLQQSLRSGELTIDGVRAPTVALHQTPPSHLRSAVRIQRPTIIQPTQRPARVVHGSNPSIVRGPGATLPGLAASQGRPTMPVVTPATAPFPSTGIVKTRQVVATMAKSVQQQRPLVTSVAGSSFAPLPTSVIRMSTTPSNVAYTSSITSMTPFHTSSTQSSSSPSIKKDKASSSFTSGDDDINDVAAMGGVNLAEESQRMQGATDLIGTQMRSCKDETFLQTGLLHKRIAKLCVDNDLDEPSPDIIALISHATQDRLKTLIEKLSIVAEHRTDVVKLEGSNYDEVQDVRGQLKFLADLDRLERRRHEEAEREMLLRAAKSRTKTEDPEKEKLKAKAKEMQRLEEEQLRHEKANNTALQAIGGPKKKLRLDEQFATGSFAGRSSLTNAASMAMRPRTKRVNVRDLVFLMEQEKQLKQSPILWKTYLN